ncbi:SAF domain-containing protein [Embleya hyalina]|uniref:Membrane protein n=1 Tax=Embleya hyalina TaxID=516124 RepID=A0A401YSN2_9ACTN|nr:SAF domain-containing protein [Embleya hyalina]GCD97576.1 membrane protein [Embleya hyalina]
MKAATERPSGNGVATPGATAGAMPVTPTRSLGARRRRPALIALSVALIAAGGLGSAAFYQMGDKRVPVLAVARTVPYGQTIAAEDLRVVEINDAPGLRPIGSGSKGLIVGKRAAVELRAGSLLTSDQVTEKIAIQPGETLVPIAVDATRMPVQRVTPGTRILVVTAVAAPAGANAVPAQPVTVAATVIRAAAADPNSGSGKAVLDVAVPAKDGPTLALQVVDGRFSIVVLNTGNADAAPNPAPGKAGGTP